MSARSCDQLCPITADHMDMHTDHQGTDDQCALMISVAQKCHLSESISASTCQCPSVPQCHISVHTSAHQCHKSVPI
ncbi:unnamed protein product [Staurois parvus]|uniref:Uncharacterized protein n=1 Tax=Staurois parvus TaxID=386267 RepID=A0ABN9FSZ1_9NEOB|nr:unnamed protein product [Staurois parvus]